MTVRQDLLIRQGETWSFVWTKRDAAGVVVDLTGYSARMAIRTGYSGSLAAYLSTGPDAAGGLIALGGALGTVTLSLTAAQSGSLASSVEAIYDLIETGAGLSSRQSVKPTVDFIYDLELVSGAGVVTRELEGRACVYREVTT